MKSGSIALEPARKNTVFMKRLKKSIPLYILLIPSFILLVLFAYIPLYGVVIAFKQYAPAQGIWGSPWVGFKHFIKYFNSYQFENTIKNTLYISIYGLLVGFPLPIALALLCNQIRIKTFKKVFQVITYLPHFISTVVMCGIIIIFLSPTSSVFSHMLASIGIEMPNIMAKSSAFSSVYVWSDVWQHLGWDSIIYLAALSAIDPTYYEAATIDGATRWQKIKYIDLPLLMSTAIVLLIMRVGNILGVGWEKVLLLQNGRNLIDSEVISTYVYKIGMQGFQYSLSSAIGLFNTAINVAILFLANYIAKKTTKVGIF